MASASHLLDGRTAVVTGASRGIGAAITRNLAAKGCSTIIGVYSSDGSAKSAHKLANDLSELHHIRCVMVQADLGKAVESVPIIIEAARSLIPPSSKDLQIDILINNAGVGGDYLLSEVPVSEFHRMYAVNVLGPLVLTQAIIPYLPHDRSGRIINISSVASSMGFLTHTLYGGTKAALEAMTRTWARELAERATVNAVNPGPVEGDMYLAAGEKLWRQLEPFQLNTPLSKIREGIDDEDLVELSISKMGGRRPAYWHEVAGIVGMLCTVESGWCTGSVVSANGGFKFGC